MEICITPRTLQDGRFTKFDVSEINEEMYLAYIIYRASKHSDLRIDQNSYNRFFFYKEEGFKKLKEWLDTNEDLVDALEEKYRKEANNYSEIYEMYSMKDYWVKANYRLLKTGIPKVDAFIAKETLMQVIYVTNKYGGCRETCYFYNLSTSTKKEVAEKVEKILKAYEEFKKCM